MFLMSKVRLLKYVITIFLLFDMQLNLESAMLKLLTVTDNDHMIIQINIKSLLTVII